MDRLTKGQRTAQKNMLLYGKNFYSKLGKIGGAKEGSGLKTKATLLKKYGPNYYKDIRAKRIK